MQIGRKIYYDKSNGIVIWDKGQMSGDVVETTLEEDCQVMPLLATMDPSQLGVLRLNYGELQEQFGMCSGYSINTETETIEFIFPNNE